MRASIPVLAVLATSGPAAADGILGALLGSLTNLGSALTQELQQLSDPSHSAPQTNPPFDAEKQLVDVSGVHAWVAPGPNDERGPCPGLNALANHGYLPHSGQASVVDLISATTQVYNMELDLAAILSAYGAVLDGSGIGWSIGGQQHTGIGGSRGNYESDGSPMRGDLPQYGSNTDLVMSQFKQFLDMQPDPETANYNIDLLGDFRELRFHQSISNNPYFYYAPFSGTAVTPAAYAFIYRFMANHTAEYPAGILNQEVLKSFFAVSGPNDNLTWTPGYERIPDNWYRRAEGDPYGLFQLGYDIGAFNRRYPDLGRPGCNQGKTNSFVVINSRDTNGSDYDFSNPINSICYAISAILDVPGDLPPPVGSVGGIVGNVVEELVLPIKDKLNCVGVPSLNQTVSQTCPGYSLFGGPTGPIAPGAVQP